MPHNDILAKLKDAVRSVSDNIQNYVSNPGDLSRNGKLPANVLMEFLISLIAYSALDVLDLLARELIPIRLNRSFPRLSTAHFRRPAYFLYRPS